MELKHLAHQEIDKRKWDHLVRQIPGGNLYGQSWYLDAVCPGWEAIVDGDYRAAMPLTVRKKFGFRYLFQPLLSQQLGVFGQSQLRPEGVDEFLSSIPAAIRLVEITLNGYNAPGKKFPVDRHTTYRLKLHPPYTSLQDKYSENTRRNLRKASQDTVRFRTNVTPAEFFELLSKDKSIGAKVLNQPENRQTLGRLIPSLLNRKAGMICGIRDRYGKLSAAALMGQDRGLHYYLAPVMNEEGRESRAMFLLIDRYIHLHSEMPASLDFEGSDIPSVARFYQGFGAQPSEYTSLRINKLPWPLKQWADRRIR
jgi:hypothetical protein